MTVPDHDAADEVTVRRVGVLLLLVAVALVAAALAAIVVLGRDRDPRTALDGVVDRLGPRAGESVAGYLEAARFSAEVAEGERLALVSFTTYLDEDEVEALLDERSLRLESLLVAVPGAFPEVTDDPAALVRDLVRDAEEQIAELERLLPTVDDEEFAAFYRAELRRYRSITNRASGAIVFGAVVTGRASDLRALAAGGVVRAVEVALGVRLAPDAVVDGLRPEERSVAGEPELRPA